MELTTVMFRREWTVQLIESQTAEMLLTVIPVWKLHLPLLLLLLRWEQTTQLPRKALRHQWRL